MPSDTERFPLRSDATEVRRCLDRAREGDPDAPGQLLEHFSKQLAILRERHLIPAWTTGSNQWSGAAGSPDLSENQERQVLQQFAEAGGLWVDLIGDLRAAA